VSIRNLPMGYEGGAFHWHAPGALRAGKTRSTAWPPRWLRGRRYGTTAVCALRVGGMLYVAHAGDSRAVRHAINRMCTDCGFDRAGAAAKQRRGAVCCCSCGHMLGVCARCSLPVASQLQLSLC
jgi:hypothetical protein